MCLDLNRHADVLRARICDRFWSVVLWFTELLFLFVCRQAQLSLDSGLSFLALKC